MRSTAVTLLASLLLASCGKDPETTTTANPLLEFVPADTPYLFANLEPVPPAILDAWLLRAQPFLEAVDAEIRDARAKLATSDPEADPTFAAVAGAVLAELEGKLNRAGLESLGIALDASYVVYGNGLFPMVRLGLGDAQALRAAIGRIESSSGQAIPELESGGDRYWRITDQDDGVAVYIAILEDHLVLSAAPVSAEATFLPLFLAQQRPQAAQADGAALAQLNQAKGYTPYGSGYLDLRLAAEEVLNPSSRTSAYLATVEGHDPAAIDPACAAEARLATGFVPRMVAGVTELNDSAVGVQYQLEFEPSLAAELIELVSEVPAASTDTGNLLAVSLAIRVGRLREFARTKALALAATPFACPQLKDLNQKMQVFAEQLNQPMPLPIGNLMGLRAVITEVDLSNPQPGTARGLLSLEVENPQMVIGAASMLIPGFEQLGIEPGADPVQLTEELVSIVTPEFEVYAVMTQRAIGLSFGPGMRDALVPFMEEKSGNDGAFVSLDHDLATLAGLQQHHAGGELDEQQLRLIEAYQAMAGRARLSLSFTEDGLSIDSRSSFK